MPSSAKCHEQILALIALAGGQPFRSGAKLYAAWGFALRGTKRSLASAACALDSPAS
jgi:hypothetical protein